ncbi:MAG TPA: hypothetical protein VKH15_15310 [Candidatus Acidoferrum sp.]|nr:hypothetical protein [Candidatus Acidoferrum sp.]
MKATHLTVAFLGFSILISPRLSSAAQSAPPPDVPALLQKLVASGEAQRGQIMDQLHQIQDPNLIVPPVLAALDTVDPQDAWKLLDVLAPFSHLARPEPLIRLARRYVHVPSTIETQLATIGAPARTALLKAIADECVIWEPLSPENQTDDGPASDEDPQTRRSQAFMEWVARTLGSISPAGLDDLLQMLRSHDACQSNVARAGLISYVLNSAPPADQRIVRALSAALNAPDPILQAAAVQIVEPVIGFQYAKLTPGLTKSLFSILKTHPDAEIRSRALSLLLQASGDTPKKAAEIASHDSDGSIQDLAANFLEELSAR